MVPVSPVGFMLPAAKFCTTYWLFPGSFPSSALHLAAGLVPKLHRPHCVPPSDGTAFPPLT